MRVRDSLLERIYGRAWHDLPSAPRLNDEAQDALRDAYRAAVVDGDFDQLARLGTANPGAGDFYGRWYDAAAAEYEERHRDAKPRRVVVIVIEREPEPEGPVFTIVADDA